MNVQKSGFSIENALFQTFSKEKDSLIYRNVLYYLMSKKFYSTTKRQSMHKFLKESAQSVYDSIFLAIYLSFDIYKG